MANRFLRFISLPKARKRLLLEAVLLLVKYRVLLSVRPFGSVSKDLGTFAREAECTADVQESEVREIKWAIAAACFGLPWKNTCLVRAFAAKKMLDRRNISATVYLGLRKKEKASNMEAHAWVLAGDVVVTGFQANHDYTVAAFFC